MAVYECRDVLSSWMEPGADDMVSFVMFRFDMVDG